MTNNQEKSCYSLPLYNSPEVCSRCRDLDGVTIVKDKKGTGADIFSAWMTYKLQEAFGRGRVFPRYLDGNALDYLEERAKHGNFLRASGDCLCPVCGREYREHPADRECPTFVLLCNGSVMKL